MKNAFKLREKTTIAEIAELRTILGEDRRDHPEWEIEYANWYFIDFELSRTMMYISHTGAEKSRNVADQINTIILLMRRKFPKFTLEGEITVRDEYGMDTFFIDSDGIARQRKEIQISQQTLDFLRTVAKNPVDRNKVGFKPEDFPTKTRAYMAGLDDGQVLLAQMIVKEIDV